MAAHGSGHDLDWDLPQSDPWLCLDAIVEVLARIPADPSNRHIQVLAAGPLEDLLRYHGGKVVDRIEALARQQPAFRMLLNGVWGKRIDPDVMARLARYRSQAW